MQVKVKTIEDIMPRGEYRLAEITLAVGISGTHFKNLSRRMGITPHTRQAHGTKPYWYGSDVIRLHNMYN